MLRKIVTGGQTGVDRAALDAAILLKIEYGGSCPKGRLDELGIIPKEYKNLEELSGEFKTNQENYDARTIKNIEDSDATLIIVPNISLSQTIKDGTKLMIEKVNKQKKPFLIVDLSESISINSEMIINWLKENTISILNIGGPRESTCPGIYQASLELLERMLREYQNSFSLKIR